MVAIAQGVPHRDEIGMRFGIGLSLCRQIPQIGVALGKGTQAATDDAAMIEGDEDFAAFALVELDKLFDGWNKTTHLEPVVRLEESVEASEFLFRLYLAGLHPHLIDVGDAATLSACKPVLGSHGMERVVYLLPADGEIAVASKMAVAEHLLGKVAELGKQAQVAPELSCDGGEQMAKHLRLVGFFVILPLAVDVPLGEEIGREERAATANDSQQMPQDVAVLIVCNGHIGSLSWSLLDNPEQVGAVEEIAAIHLRQRLAIGNYFDYNIRHGIAKILKSNGVRDNILVFLYLCNKKLCILEISFIGAGNLASNLAPALAKAGHHIRQVYSRTKASAEALAKDVGAEATTRLGQIAPDSDLYVFSVKDAVLGQLIGEVARKAREKMFVHTAGSVPMDIFKGFVEHYGVIYPMQTFSKTALVEFGNIPCFIEASDNRTLSTVEEVAKSVSNRVMQMDSEHRKYLHLAAVLACNFTNHCYAMAERLLEQHQIPFEVMLPLIDRTAEKVHTLSPLEAQTGPAVRFDTNVMERQKQLLENEDVRNIYDLMSRDIHRYAITKSER